MKICQPIEKDLGVENVLHGHFRTSPRFLIFDSENKELQSFEGVPEKNEKKDCQHARLLKEQQVDIAIVGGITRDCLGRLYDLGIEVYQAAGHFVEDNLKAFQNGELKELTFENIR
jgi:predicted Fe-Mo cluster-binding NifX family protein